MSSAGTTRERRKEPTLKTTSAPNTEPTPHATPNVSARARAEDSAFSLLDILRTLVFVVLASSALSYFVTRNSFTWGVARPKWTHPEVIKTWIQGEKQYTDEDLKEFDGTDPDKPIFLAINGTIYDVSAGRRHYGPGGSYHFFAGVDASRAYVTSCFKDDRTPDMRGVEEAFLPLDDPEVDVLYTSKEMKILKEQERRKAKQEVYKALKHWVDFFANSKKYHKVGMVKREKGWETKGEPHPLCQQAIDGRKKRERPAGI